MKAKIIYGQMNPITILPQRFIHPIKNTFEKRQYCIGYTTKISITLTNLVNVNFIGPRLHINLGPQLLNVRSSFDKIR
jgi:hypothetical protein